MKLHEFMDVNGNKVWVQAGHVTMRDQSGELLRSFPVLPTAGITVDPGVDASSAQVQVEKAADGNPLGGKWSKFDFVGGTTADAFKLAIAESVREALDQDTEEPDVER